MKVKATSTGTPPLSGAEAFARLLVAMVEKKPVLRVVEKSPSMLNHGGQRMLELRGKCSGKSRIN